MNLLVSLIFWSIFSFGLSYAAGNSKISLRTRSFFARFRGTSFFVELVECPACFGFWQGVVGGFLLPEIVPVATQVWSPLLLGFFTCGTGYLLGRATGWLREE